MGLSRLELQDLLEELLGSKQVYFQAPGKEKMQYPAIVYEHSANSNRFADDRKYIRKRRYTVTVIDRNPDSPIAEKVGDLPYCEMTRHFTSDHLNNYVFNLYC